MHNSEITTSIVAEMILEEVLTESQQWVVLVGDGKTYKYLQKVKRMYGVSFIFSGDWQVCTYNI